MTNIKGTKSMFFPGGRACLQERVAGILKENAVHHRDGAKAFRELQNSRECHLLLICSRSTCQSMVELKLQFRGLNTQPTVLFSGMSPPSRPCLFTTQQNIDFKIVNQQSPFPDRRTIFLRRNSHFLKVVLNSYYSFQFD